MYHLLSIAQHARHISYTVCMPLYIYRVYMRFIQHMLFVYQMQSIWTIRMAKYAFYISHKVYIYLVCHNMHFMYLIQSICALYLSHTFYTSPICISYITLLIIFLYMLRKYIIHHKLSICSVHMPFYTFFICLSVFCHC